MEVGLPGNKKCVILIQARINSTRLPGKILFNFFTDTIIERIIKIAKKVSNNKDIFIISGDKKKNRILLNLAKKNNIRIYFGHEANVFLRFRNFLKTNYAKKYKYVYRITSDNYLIQPKIIKIMIKDAINKKKDYGFVRPLSHYAGEIISKKLFFKKSNISKYAKEHVTWDFRKNKEINSLRYSKKFMNLNHEKSVTLDTIKDLINMKIFEKKFKGLKNIDNYKYLKRIQNDLWYNR
jgi:spore coat polysaccharide biosynthesis protein SpsF (cytidylyltransferase family)